MTFLCGSLKLTVYIVCTNGLKLAVYCVYQGSKPFVAAGVAKNESFPVLIANVGFGLLRD